MKFTPKTEEEVGFKLLDAGIYDFDVMTALDKVSQAGNDMIELKLAVYGPDGNARHIFDYLMEKIEYKLRHAADACGLLDKYETGEFGAEDFIGKAGKLKLGIQKDKTGQYPDKNTVQDYIKRDNLAEPAPTRKTAPDLDDEIPF